MHSPRFRLGFTWERMAVSWTLLQSEMMEPPAALASLERQEDLCFASGQAVWAQRVQAGPEAACSQSWGTSCREQG